MRTYRVDVYREGSWWIVAIPEIDGLTQAETLEEVPAMARDYIAVTLGVPSGSVAVDPTVVAE